MAEWVGWFERALARYATPWQYLLESAEYMRPVFGAIRTCCPPPSTVLEVGSGIGVAAAILAAHGYRVSGIERDEGVLALAKTMPWMGAGLPLTCFQGHAEDPPGGFDVATSLGLVEHEEVQGRRTMLAALRRAARWQFVVIPSPHQLAMEPPTMGEKAIPLDKLVADCRKAGWDVMDAFDFGGEEGSRLSQCVVGRLP